MITLGGTATDTTLRDGGPGGMELSALLRLRAALFRLEELADKVFGSGRLIATR